MAHECPECGLMCYCGGDIDDLLMNGIDEEIHCRHYLRPECDGYELDGEDYEELEAEEPR